MPFPLIPLIAAGATIAGQGINAWSTAHQNRRSREFSETMYDKQYQDNVAFWRMQNEYNSPDQQMQRLKGAGLNPNLVYGGSPGGTAGTAGSVQTPDVQTPQFRTPEWGNMVSAGGLQMISSMYDLEIKQAQIDNLKADNTTKLAQAALISAQTGRTEFDLEFESELRQVSADARRESLRKMQIDNTYTLNEDERRAATTSQSLQESVERILNLRVQRTKDETENRRIEKTIESISRDVTLKDMDIELRKMGIHPQDPMWSRILGRVINHVMRTNNLPTKQSLLNQLPSVPPPPTSGMGGGPGGGNVSWRKFLLGF